MYLFSSNIHRDYNAWYVFINAVLREGLKLHPIFLLWLIYNLGHRRVVTSPIAREWDDNGSLDMEGLMIAHGFGCVNNNSMDVKLI